ncbi:MAG: CheY-like chemotaxis protein [Planctomycetota bacterium]|jgi:CheY-like chemotaxis protein
MIAEHYLKKVGDRIGRISHASSLQSATEALQELEIDVVLLDLTLPDSRLDETLEALKALTRAHTAPFVALSSLSSEDIARKACDNGAASFLGKQDLNAPAIHELLDELGFASAGQGPGSSPSGTTGEDSPIQSAAPTPVVSQPAAAPESLGEQEPSAPAAPSTPAALAALASQIAHDAMGWASNLAFRTRAMEADPAIQASEELQASLASIRASADALTSFISGARSLLLTELRLDGAAAAETEEVVLSSWLPAAALRWKKTTRDKHLDIHVEATSSVCVPKESGVKLLQQTFAALLQNARQHAARTDRPVRVYLRESSKVALNEGPNVAIEVIDDGGPWELDELDPALGSLLGSSLGSPLVTGKKKSPSAGLGLFIATRAMKALGGALTIHERDDAPGAYAIRITLPRRAS